MTDEQLRRLTEIARVAAELARRVEQTLAGQATVTVAKEGDRNGGRGEGRERYTMAGKCGML